MAELVGAVTDDGVALAVQVAGPAAAPPLLLLPGQANSHRWWDGLRAGFESRFRTITFDYRGTGGSAAHPGRPPWSTALFAADAAAVLDHLGHDAALVYGTSMGGRVAQLLAVEHPRRVSRLVLACTSPGGRHAVERDGRVRRALADPDPARRRSALLELMYTPDGVRRHGPRSALLGDPDMTPEASRAHLRASAAHDAFDRLSAVAVPTLVLHGGADRMVPSVNGELISEQIPGAQLRVFPTGRHGFFDEFADAVTPLVIDFLSG